MRENFIEKVTLKAEPDKFRGNLGMIIPRFKKCEF